MEIIEILILISLFILHWITQTITTMYVFVRKNKKYDYIYFLIIFTIILHWFFNNNDCVISSIEKNILYKDKNIQNSNPSSTFYIENIYIRTIILIILTFLFIYNFIYMLNKYNVSLVLLIPFALVAFIYFSYFRLCEIQNHYENKS